ncbi:MAG: hypothetical protein H6982_16560, partial [Chromatiales bacterium]|nr:hypothetical protein [Chromatiales bacterium]
MRWVVILLALANIALLAHSVRTMEPPAEPPASPAVPDGTVNRLLLLSEVDPDTLRLRGAAPAPAPAPGAAAAAMPAGTCYRIGPLESEARIAEVRRYIEGHDGEATLRVDERRETAQHWVFMPPLPSRAAADERVERMRAAGLADIYIIPRGDMANAISLGVYTQDASRDRRLGQLRAAGFGAQVSTRFRTVR